MQVKNIPLNERIIFALDVSTLEQAKELVRILESETAFFKVGLQLFLAAGFEIVEWLTIRGLKVMLDLKFYDIPKTVELAVDQLGGRDITFATVHGNRAIMEAAARASADVGILAVTVLTSLGQDDMEEMGTSIPIEELVIRRAVAARDAGCVGVVCSPQEVAMVRSKTGDELVLVTPGVRPENVSGPGRDDQARFATPYDAIINGSDHLVIGRPIKEAKHPLEALKAIKDEVSRALRAIN